jgi:hypothetical protein
MGKSWGVWWCVLVIPSTAESLKQRIAMRPTWAKSETLSLKEQQKRLEAWLKQ